MSVQVQPNEGESQSTHEEYLPALTPSFATTFSTPLKLGYSSTSCNAFLRSGVSSLAKVKATDEPTVAANAENRAP